jgi:uncharacterized membrane protein YfcA
MLSLDPADAAGLLVLIVVAAILYSSVGHGGASGYIAVMGLHGLPGEVIKPAALVMNVFVTAVVFIRLYRAGHFNRRLFLPFALGSIPLAYVGGAQKLDEPAYQLIVGAALWIAAIRLLIEAGDRPATGTPRPWVSLPVGAATGYLSGLTGVGGGIFLSPILLLLRWTDMRTNAAIASAFILVNSIAGLLGFASQASHPWPPGLPVLVPAAFVGGLIGSELAIRRLAPARLRKVLGIVLVIAGGKMFLTALG